MFFQSLSSPIMGSRAAVFAIVFAIGCISYFSLKREPAWEDMGLAGLSIGIIWAIGHFFSFFTVQKATAVLLVGYCGFANAFFHTHWQNPVTALPWYGTLMEGRIIKIDSRTSVDSRARVKDEAIKHYVTLSNVKYLSGVEQDTNPLMRDVRVRLRYNDPKHYQVGQKIELRAMLRSISSPSFSHDYDQQFRAWFENINGAGYALSVGKVVEDGEGNNFRLKFYTILGQVQQRIQQTRQNIANVIMSQTGCQDCKAIEAILLAGETGLLAESVRQEFAASGLSHLLAVAGLHLASVMGVCVFVLRKGLACWPYAALHWPIKKIALITGFLLGGGYAVLTGLHVPVLRSYFMLAWIILALLVERPVLSLLRFGWAIGLLLIVWPELVRDVSFQMSFTAVLGLICGYQIIHHYEQNRYQHTPLWKRSWLAAEGRNLFFASFFAGMATLPVIAAHFGTFQPYFIIANLIAVPITSLWVLPWGILSLFLMVFGKASWALAMMGIGIKAIILLAHMVARLPGSVFHIPLMPEAVLWCAIGGVTLCCLGTRRLRLVGGIVLAGVIGVMAFQLPPNLLVSPDGRLVGLIDHKGLFIILGHDPYIEKRWMTGFALNSVQHFSSEEGGDTATRNQAFFPVGNAVGDKGQPWPEYLHCQSGGICRIFLDHFGMQGREILLYYEKKKREDPRPPALLNMEKANMKKACQKAALVLTLVAYREPCSAFVGQEINTISIRKSGALNIWFKSASLRLISDQQVRGMRPWVREPGQRGLPNLPLAASE
ncbi:ComEC/Rec2 family competence protein [Entomobacter blattae]|uniref:Competence protein n=1 Tax=Entomobacter blattae TaxID=2762277 RepID=A0A7H1NUN6_9PROT|nr:ComEC/Rec2 family competence protein [Entomobacter blattae]QNT79496.1 Competence protein [Entomobacter blattae]